MQQSTDMDTMALSGNLLRNEKNVERNGEWHIYANIMHGTNTQTHTHKHTQAHTHASWKKTQPLKCMGGFSHNNANHDMPRLKTNPDPKHN